MNDVKEILEKRGEKYGSFVSHSAISQHLKKGITFRNAPLPYYQQEALEMIFHKCARILNGDSSYVDSWLDIAGYATLVVEELDKGTDREA